MDYLLKTLVHNGKRNFICDNNNLINSNSSVIDNDNAKTYLSAIHNHDIDRDVAFLSEKVISSQPNNILDVGFGSGALLNSLVNKDIQLYGLEKSLYLYKDAESKFKNKHINIFLSDLYDYTCQIKFNIIIFSFVLHHIADFREVLKKYFSFLSKNGSFFILDRVALTPEGISQFSIFWQNSYKSQHEWQEKLPNIISRNDLETFVLSYGYYCEFTILPHDNRHGTEQFPKTFIKISKRI